jgi:hypothetical protein
LREGICQIIYDIKVDIVMVFGLGDIVMEFGEVIGVTNVANFNTVFFSIYRKIITDRDECCGMRIAGGVKFGMQRSSFRCE